MNGLLCILMKLGVNFTEYKKGKYVSLLDHDSNSVLVDCCGPETSWDRFETEEVVRFKAWIFPLYESLSKWRPFKSPGPRLSCTMLSSGTLLWLNSLSVLYMSRFVIGNREFISKLYY